MKATTKRFGLPIIIILLAACSPLVTSVSAQELPSPGTTIDKSNLEKYKNLFPPEFLPAFEDGFGGLIAPIHVNVKATEKRQMYQPYLDYSAKNKGKFSLDKEGFPGPGWARQGLPFPDLKEDDPDFATKLMWNYELRYQFDESFETGKGVSFKQRHDEKLQWITSRGHKLFFKNRMVLDPRPDLDNPLDLFSAFLLQHLTPESMTNTMTLTYRYADPRKPDDTFLYLPSMRRVIRTEAGQRSTPIVGSISALDDFEGFAGNVAEFNYTLVGKQKVLAVMEAGLRPEDLKAQGLRKLESMPFNYDGYEARDVYVVDIKPKDPKYPQSIKRLYLDKDLLLPLYAVAWDRANKIWKVFFPNYKEYTIPDGSIVTAFASYFGVDVQFGMASHWVADYRLNSENWTWNDFTQASLLKRGR